MARLAVAFLTAAALAACSRSAAVRPAVADAASFARLVDGHNRVRARVRPPARPPLPNLTWSAEIAAAARDWAEGCRFRHSGQRGKLGENLFAMSGNEPDAAVLAAAVRSWAAESADYDSARDACRSGKVCGHYTQMVWRDTRWIGCALARCERGSPFGTGSWSLVVCNYAPPGNYRGRKPY